ncbi:MAG: hypothetical protein ACEQSB_01435 [Undibacterium sp.]
MNQVAAKNHFGALVITFDVKNGRIGAGTMVLGSPVAAPALMAISA